MLLAVSVINGCEPAKSDVTVVFYNCENFFDNLDNAATADDDFTPAGACHYSQRIYEQKLHNIATVLQSMGGPNRKKMPAIIGLAEVENNKVLDDLIHQPELERNHYKAIIYRSHDKRGINTALLYDPGRFNYINSVPLPLKIGDSILATRDILHVYGVLRGDTVHIFVNHWPSRRNDIAGIAGNYRTVAATTLKHHIDTLASGNTSSKVIVMGDFNDNPNDSSLAVTSGIKSDTAGLNGTELYNPFAIIYSTGQRTESYKGQWNLFDQVIISASLMKNGYYGLHFKSAAIYHPSFMANRNGTPFRGFLGNRWNNGYSDHFPVMVSLGSN